MVMNLVKVVTPLR